MHAPPKPKPVPEEKPVKKDIVSYNGEATWFDEGPSEAPVWKVEWKRADVVAVGETPGFGKMIGATGEIYHGDDIKSFKADRAIAQSSNVLTLTGNVTVHSPKSAATLTCDKLVYDANEKVFDAQGNVSLKGKNIDITGVPEAKADADFTQVASPDLFKRPNAKS